MAEIKPYTIFLTIGPSNCGKSFFCKEYLIPKLKENYPRLNRAFTNVTYISSDDTRRELLGDPTMDKNHPAMLTASKAAFDLLFQKLKSAMVFPVTSEFIIVDTKGTNESFREQIYSLAREYRYGVVPVVFNYEFNDYGKFAPINAFTKKDIKKVRESIFGLKRKPAVKNVIMIKNPGSYPEIECNQDDYDLIEKCKVDNKKELTVISDIHGCYDEFVELLGLNGIIVKDHEIVENVNNKTLIIAGDYIDRGPKVEDCIEFLHKNPEVIVVVGNHDNRLYKELTQGLEHIDAPYFDSFYKLNDESKKKFIEVFERSVPFVRNDIVIVTHAPCNSNALGKIDTKSLERQRYFAKSHDENTTIYDSLNSIHVFDEDIHPMLHVFGHIPTSTPGRTINGRMLIDGGCDRGGCLVSVSITPTGKAFFRSVPSKQPKDGELMKYSRPEDQEKKIDITQMEYKDRRRIWKMCEGKVNFISGTMSPCDKKDNNLETIDSGIEFFLQHGVSDIVMEPKYMGSRCNMYLFRTNEESYCVSRNGFKIKDVHDDRRDFDLYPLYDMMRDRLKEQFIDGSSVRAIIIDGELMPWSALGESLIQDFRYVGDNAAVESHFLKENGFEEAFNGLRKKYEESEFATDKDNLSKKELVSKYGSANYNTFKAVTYFKGYIPVDEREEMIHTYFEQLRLYGSKGELNFKPFAILKFIFNDGTEIIPYEEPGTYNNKMIFDSLNPDGCHRYDLNNEEDIQKCKDQFYKYTTEQHYEGVVLKPNSLKFSSKYPPYLKVRNPKYLSIIYGFDYLTPDKHKKLCDKKSIRTKMKASISEWKKGLEMLKVNYNDISESNEHLKQLYAAFIADEVKEQGMDPRL